MKKLILFFFIFVSSINLLIAQISDAQVIEYVKTEAGKGASQQTIASELLKKGATPEQLQRIRSQVNQQNQTTTTSNQSYAGNTIRTQPTGQSNPSRSATDSTPSSSTKSEIFGKNIFNNKNLTFDPSLNIPTPENYTLGPGDEVVIDVWGASQTSVRQVISPEGSIVVERLGPVYLNGMTIKEANSYIQQKFASVFSGIGNENGSSQIKLTLGQIRTIQINIMGEVIAPGTYSLSSLSSVFHALYSAGGINDIGSLRNIQVYRKGKLIETVDIYKYILEGDSSSDIRLMDGDFIIVPTYVSLVKISGKVKRPMYYEMTFIETLSDLLSYAGGFTGDAYKDEISLTRKTGGYDKVRTLSSNEFDGFILNDGDEITIGSGLNLFENRVEIKGAVYRPGYYEVSDKIRTVKDLITKAGGLRGNAFLDRAVLTREKEDLTFETLPINLRTLLAGTGGNDIILRKNDILLVASDSVLVELGNVTIYGAVNSPGSYQYADNMSIEDLIIQAGGLLNSASTAKVDIARRIVDPSSTESPTTIAQTYTFSIKDGLIADGHSTFTLEPYDQIYIRRSPGYIEQRNIIIEGEVLFPGTYALQEKTERLSDLIKRAGGITPHAYASGARLIREHSELELEQQRESIRRLSNSANNDSISPELLNIEKFYPIGIELDKAINNPHLQYDLVLKPGDRLIIPEYDNTIKINGAVMYPNTVLFKKGEKVSYYIDQAGGYNDLAEKKRAYIVYMNGTVARVKGSNRNAIQPGCEIIIPSKEPRDKMTLGEIIGLGSSVTSMASVVALLINALTK